MATRWFEYFWARLGDRRLTGHEWRALETLVREEATRRFRNADPTTLQMLLAACDVSEHHPSMDALVERVRHSSGGRLVTGDETTALQWPGRRRRVV